MLDKWNVLTHNILRISPFVNQLVYRSKICSTTIFQQTAFKYLVHLSKTFGSPKDLVHNFLQWSYNHLDNGFWQYFVLGSKAIYNAMKRVIPESFLKIYQSNTYF